MAWFKDAIVKAGNIANQELQRRQQQRQSGYYGQGQQQHGQAYQQGGYPAGGVSSPSSATGPSWQQQQQPQSPQYQQPQSPQYQQPQQQYPQHHHQEQQYAQVPPPPPYRSANSQPQPQAESYQAQLAQAQAEAQAQLQAAQAQAAQVQAEAQAQLQAAQAQARQEAERSRIAQQEAAQKLEAQWRDAERLAAHYKAEYEAQMRKAEEDLAKLRIEEEQQKVQAQEELARLRAEESRLQQCAEEDVVREQQRLLDEIQRQVRGEEDVKPPLPRRPVSVVGVSPEQQRPQSYYPPQQGEYLSPGPGLPSQAPPSPSQQVPYIPPPPPPGPPPAQATSPTQQGHRNSYLSPSSEPAAQPGVSPSQQQAPYYPPPPPSPSQPQQYQPQYSSTQGQATSPTQQGHRNSFLSPSPAQATTTQQQIPSYPPPPPSPAQPQQHQPQYASTSPQQAQPTSPTQQGQRDWPVPPPPSQGATSPTQQQTPSYTSPPSIPAQPQQYQARHASAPSQQPPVPPQPAAKPPRVTTPEPPKEHACGVKPLADCASGLTSHPQYWFFHAAAPDFTICSRCYVDHIYDTRFRDAFTKAYYSDKVKRRCRFESRRVKDTLFPAAIESGSLSDCIAFMEKRMTIKDCPQQNEMEGEMWYMTPDIPLSTICPACFEDTISVTSFAKHYQLQKPQGASFCDGSVWFLKRKLKDYAKENNWAKFTEEFNTRCKLPKCPGFNNIKANERTWYKSKIGPSGLQACGTCYFDYFYASEDEGKFEQVAGGNFETKCSMGQFNILIPMQHALELEDRSIFWKAVYGVDKQPFCHTKGIKGGTFYTLPNDPPGWGICGACFEGIIKPVGGSRWFVQDKSVDPNLTYLCCFNLNHSRAPGGLQAYVDARNVGDWKILGDWTAKWTTVPPCNRIKYKAGKNRRWWGWGVVAICEECYLTFAEGTALEPRFALKGAREPDKERMCDLFSPRMRALYMEACNTGDLQSFLAFAEQRHVIYTQTVMRIEQILVNQQILAMQAQSTGIQGTFYKNMGWMQDTTMGHSYTVGNSYAGYGHANEWLLKGYTLDRQADEMRSQVGGHVSEVGMLEARWKQVE